MSKLGKRITELRKSKKWSQDTLAAKMDVTRQTIYNWESGSVAPTADKLEELSAIFKVPIGSFFEEEIAVADATPQNVSEEEKSPSGADLPAQKEPKKRKSKALKIALLSFCGVGIGILSIWLAIIGTSTFSNRGDDQAVNDVWHIVSSDLFIMLLIVIVILISIIVITCTIAVVRKKKQLNVKEDLRKE